MKKRILVISQYFYPENFRINDICKEWVKRGHDVTVVTGIPNYPQGKFFDGYGVFKKRKEIYEGVNVIRLPIVPRGKGSICLALNYASFVVSGFFWKLFANIEADKVFVFEVSPMTQALLGVWYAKKKKIPCTIYVQDLWPENVEAVAGIHNKKVIGAIDKMVNYIYRNCEIIFTTSPSFVSRIEERKSAWDNAGNSKVKYWPQYAEEFYRPLGKMNIADVPQNDRFKVVFTGNIGYAQGLDILPKTAELLKKDGEVCEFIIIGDGRYKEEFIQEIEKRNVTDMFHLLGRKKAEDVPGYLACCDMAFISFSDDPLFYMTIPAKLQSYLACGIPILAVAGGETKRIVEEAGCGYCCPLGDAQGVKETIIKFMNHEKHTRDEMGIRASQYFNTHYEKSVLLDEMEKYL